MAEGKDLFEGETVNRTLKEKVEYLDKNNYSRK